MLGCDCHPRHNHGRLGWDRFLLADGFELCFSLPASPLIISFCFFPMTDESARGEKNQRDKFCSVSAAEPPLAHTSLLRIYTRGPELGGQYSLVVQPVVCTKGTNQCPLQKVWQSSGSSLRITAKLFCSLTATELPSSSSSSCGHQQHRFLEDPRGHFLRATPKLEPAVRPILHVAPSGWDTG